ncbi:hypothetical protein JOQ06_011138, partial [Pogonophryne albipinna]
MYHCDAFDYWGQGTTVTVSNAPITMKLIKSSKEMFNNNQTKIDCVISGQDETTVNKFNITWQVNEAIRPTSEETSSGGIKTSTMRLSLHESLNGTTPKVTVHILPDEDINENPSEVTLVCLVFNSVKQDYYIAWAEHIGQNTPIYQDGINFFPDNRPTDKGYSVTSIYTTNKTKWQSHSFSCNVWPADPRESKLSPALSCTDEAIDEEDEYSSLWSTTLSFIFLFICSLLYSMIFSMVK